MNAIPIRDLSELVGSKPEDPFDDPRLPAREDVLDAAGRALGPNVSFPASDGRVDVARVPMTASEAQDFEEGLQPFVDSLLETVRSGKFVVKSS